MSLDKSLVIYHGNCYDGFTAAWVARQAMPGCELYPGFYGEPPPDVTNRCVFVLDFSYPRAVMEDMNERAVELMVLDHHKTARDDCEGLDFCIFDMGRSGCRLAWDELVGGEPPEWLLRIEDRDLWRFKYSDTAAIHAYVASLPMTLENWDAINAARLVDLVDAGKTVLRYIETYIEKAAKESRLVHLGEHVVAAVNVPYQNASEMGSHLLTQHPTATFAMGYFQRADGRWQYSLRSRDSFDVSSVAKAFGGGGHADAAGFDTEDLLRALE